MFRLFVFRVGTTVYLLYFPNPALSKIPKSHVPFIATIPSLAPPFLPNVESRALNKPNSGSRKTYWGPSQNATLLGF